MAFLYGSHFLQNLVSCNLSLIDSMTKICFLKIIFWLQFLLYNKAFNFFLFESDYLFLSTFESESSQTWSTPLCCLCYPQVQWNPCDLGFYIACFKHKPTCLADLMLFGCLPKYLFWNSSIFLAFQSRQQSNKSAPCHEYLL